MKQFTNLAYLCSVKTRIFITDDEIANSFIAISLSKKNYYGFVIAKCCEMFFVEMNEQSASNA